MWYQTEQGIYHSLILIILGKKYVMMLRSALPKLNIAGGKLPFLRNGNNFAQIFDNSIPTQVKMRKSEFGMPNQMLRLDVHGYSEF